MHADAADTQGEGPTADAPNPPAVLNVTGEPGQSKNEVMAAIGTGAIADNAWTAVTYSSHIFGAAGGLPYEECIDALKARAAAVHGGNLNGLETMLVSQTVAMNSIFNEMARRASMHMGTNLDAFERYMRMAMKAQAQCRTTAETLAVIKQGPAIFAKQANVSNGGPQQVNNGVQSAQAVPTTRAPARKSNAGRIKLLEQGDEQGMDTRAQGATGRIDSPLAPVGAIDRTENRKRQGAVIAKR